jgi:hypothetical protein
MSIPVITGPDILRAIKQRAERLPPASSLAISLLDSYDLFKLELRDLTTPEFAFDAPVAERIITDLRHGNVAELGKALGVRLMIDKERPDSLIPNAGIIRSAGAFANDAQSLAETLSFLDQLRHGDRASR